MSRTELSESEFQALYERLRRTALWGPADRRGALNNISPADVVAAASGVRTGRTVSLAAPLASEVAPDNPYELRSSTSTSVTSTPATSTSGGG